MVQNLWAWVAEPKHRKVWWVGDGLCTPMATCSNYGCWLMKADSEQLVRLKDENGAKQEKVLSWSCPTAPRQPTLLHLPSAPPALCAKGWWSLQHGGTQPQDFVSRWCCVGCGTAQWWCGTAKGWGGLARKQLAVQGLIKEWILTELPVRMGENHVWVFWGKRVWLWVIVRTICFVFF